MPGGRGDGVEAVNVRSLKNILFIVLSECVCVCGGGGGGGGGGGY